MTKTLTQIWQSRLVEDCPTYPAPTRDSIVQWLLGENPQRLDTLPPAKRAVTAQAMEFLYTILRRRYLGTSPEQAYRHLLQRLASLVMLRQKIRAWVAQSRDRQRTVLDVLEEVLQEMLNSDRYLQEQMAWIACCTEDQRLRNTLIFATLEEYCLRPIRSQPLLLYRFVNYLRRSQRGGVTQVPVGNWIKFISEEVLSEEGDEPLSLVDKQALELYQDAQVWEEQQELRILVQQEFESYLRHNVDATAAQWLELYLQGRSQESIAQTLGIPVKQVYRLREKVTYHAIRVFATKQKPEIVAQWLKTSLNDHHLGLTLQEWQEYWQGLTTQQRQLIEALKAGQTIDQIAATGKVKPNELVKEWTQLYIAAQRIRNRDP